jgi:diphthamide synthase (EF-2-diphthine--ammonia ligase)
MPPVEPSHARLRVLLSWSGGKDAAWALHVLRQRDEVEVVGLLTTITEGHERIAMQGIRVEVLHAQAAATGLPVIEARMPQRADNAVYEATFTAALARAMIDGGLRANLCCVDTQQLNASFAGCTFDAALLAELPSTVDPCGENGEFHTCVSAGPMFAAPIALERGDTVLRDECFAYADFTPA